MNTEDLIVSLYGKKEKSTKRLMRDFNKSQEEITEILTRHGHIMPYRECPTREDIEEFKELYQIHGTAAEVARVTGWSQNAVSKNLGENFKQGGKNLLEDEIEYLKELYTSGLSSREVAKEMGISKTTVLKFIEDSRPSSNHRIHSVNESYFDKIDSQEKAYWLGFLYADGSNYEKGNKLTFSQCERNKGAIYQFKKDIEAEHPIWSRQSDGKGTFSETSVMYGIGITSKHLSESLAKLGVVANKTFKTAYPDIESCYNRHFIRGVFDGDGHVTGKSGRGVFGITGYIPFVKQIQRILIDEVDMGETKIYNIKGRVGDVRYGGKNVLTRLYSYLYDDATRFFARKKEKFEEIITY